MNKMQDDLCNDFWDWLDSVSIKYKNYEIKNAIIVYKYLQYEPLMQNGDHFNLHFNLRRFLSSIKWELKLNLLTNKMSKHNMILKGNCDSINDLSNKNLYAINFSPNDPRDFLHIATLVKRDDHSLVITVEDDVYDYFNKIEIPVILLDISNPWRRKNDLEIGIPLNSLGKKTLLLLDIFSLVFLSKAASLIDLLDILTNENGLPQTLITLQDVHAFDSVFATYFLGKIPTITLQHGMVSISKSKQNNIFKYLISDWMIVFGTNQAEILRSSGMDSKKIKILGTAKYDLYIDRIEGKLKNNGNKRVLLGIRDTMFFNKNDKMMFNFIKKLLSSKENYTVSLRFHPAVTKKGREKFVQKLKKLYLCYGVKVDISNIEDPLEDISKSTIVLVYDTTLAIEAMLLKRPIIEYLSKKEDSVKFGDYRDFSLHALGGENADALIIKLLNNDDFYNKIVEKQNNIVNSEIMLPPAIPRILKFINSLNNDKRSVKNNQ